MHLREPHEDTVTRERQKEKGKRKKCGKSAFGEQLRGVPLRVSRGEAIGSRAIIKTANRPPTGGHPTFAF
jgi:hypothetical protein